MIDIASVKLNNPLAVIVERFTGQQVGNRNIHCPFHEDRSPSMHVYADGGFKCFSCGRHGDVLDFVGYYFFGDGYKPDVHFAEVVDKLGALDIRPLPAQLTRPKPERPKLTIDLDTIYHWHETMPTDRRAYWHNRGLIDQTIDAFMLGWDGKRYTIPALYRMVPFGVKRRQSEINDGLDVKYIQIAGGRVGIFNADILAAAETAIICEGEIDCMLLYQLGYCAVTSTGGAASWKPEWVKFFAHIPNVIILFDNDDAGREGASRVKASMRRAQIVTLPKGIKDVGELWATGTAAGWLAESI